MDVVGNQKMFNKRRIADSVSDTSYVVIEIKDKSGGVYVRFVPTSWVQPLKKNGKVVVHANAYCYFPRRMPGQSKDQHLKFVKNAIFKCMSPERNEKWEQLNCRVLKTAIDCVDDAMNAEKMFSDFFDTTEAEAELQNMNNPPAKRVRKSKKPPATATTRCESSTDESESEQGISAGVIADYNVVFTTINAGGDENPNGSSGSIVQDDTVAHAQYVDSTHADGFGYDEQQETVIDLGQNNFIVQLDTIGAQLNNQNQNVRAEADELDVSSANASNCKCLDKVRNKIDYFQKRVIGEIAYLRHDVMKSIRNLTDIVLRGSNNQQESKGDTPDSDDNSDELIAKYAGRIPVDDKIKLRTINQQIKSDVEFKMFLQLEFEKISAADAAKTVQKMLNAVCTVNCFGQFTWLGTKEKDRFSEFQFLIEFIAKNLESRFPKCGAYHIIESVVKQRTKSVGEAVKEGSKGTGKCQVIPNFSSENTETPDDELPSVADDLTYRDEHQTDFDPESLINLNHLLDEFDDLK